MKTTRLLLLRAVLTLILAGLASMGAPSTTCAAEALVDVHGIGPGGPWFGNDNTVGWTFDALVPIQVTHLGVFNFNGIVGLPVGQAHRVGIWDAGGVLLLSGTVGADPGDTLSGVWEYAAVTPRTLAPGLYVIGAQYTVGSPEWVTAQPNTTDPALAFVGPRFGSGNDLPFPEHEEANLFVGPNFQFTPVPLHAELHFANPHTVSIPDVGPGSPYPSPITVAGAAGIIRKLTVTLSNLSHTAQSDVNALLVGPHGGAVYLIAAPNGTVDFPDVSLTFDDAASGPIPPLVTSGSYLPTGYLPEYAGQYDPPPAPAPRGIYANHLSTFAGSDPNGAWSLFVWDDESEDSGILAGGWSLSIDIDIRYSLTVRLTGNRVEISWPEEAAGYVLESATDIVAPKWEEVADQPMIAGSQKTVTQDVTTTPRFYRLTRPQ